MSNSPQMRFVLAVSIFARARGLLGTSANWGDARRVLVLAPCKSVHTIGMHYALDIAFVSRQGMVLRSERNVKPGRLLSCRKAALVLERPHDRAAPWPDARSSIALEIM